MDEDELSNKSHQTQEQTQQAPQPVTTTDRESTIDVENED